MEYYPYLDWYKRMAKKAMEKNRKEGYVLTSIQKDIHETPGNDMLKSKSVLSFLVKHKILIRIEWGGDDIRYYYPGEILVRDLFTAKNYYDEMIS